MFHPVPGRISGAMGDFILARILYSPLGPLRPRHCAPRPSLTWKGLAAPSYKPAAQDCLTGA